MKYVVLVKAVAGPHAGLWVYCTECKTRKKAEEWVYRMSKFYSNPCTGQQYGDYSVLLYDDRFSGINDDEN